MFFRRKLLVAGLFWVVLPTATLVQADEVSGFVEIPGEREFSGQMIARPIQPQAWAEQGVGPSPATLNDQAARNAMTAFKIVEYVWQTDEYIFQVPAGQTENQVADQLMATGNFQYVEPNWIVYPVACPDDPLLNRQWQHDADIMQSCDGWDIHTGNPSVTVGICDTGIRTTHEDLQLHRMEGYNAVDQRWESDGGQINDLFGSSGHGTITTGCAAANGDNGIGVAGVGWNLSHRMLRVSNSSGGGSSIATLNHAARTAIEAGDRVASLSYGGVSSPTNLTSATYIKSIGGLMVWAAGNSNSNLDWGNRDDDDLIVAGGTDQDDNKASFSSFGPSVDLVAPAVGVYSTNNSSDRGYGGHSGTSFACPLTAGLCALIWSANPGLTPDEVETILKLGADDLGIPGVDNTFGYGRINVFGSLSRVGPRPPRFIFPDGLPDMIDPSGGTAVRVEVVPRDLAPIPGTGLLHYNDGRGWNAVAMQEISDNVYDAVFPPTTCGADVRFYFSVEADDGQRYSDPSNAPDSSYSVLSAAGIDEILFDDLENDSGWTVGAADDDATTGIWNRMDPQGTAAQPENDHTPGGTICWVTDGFRGSDLGDRDVDNGKTTLFSSTLDLSAEPNALLSYWRWYSNDEGSFPNADVFVVDISNDGGQTWTNVETVGPTGPGTSGGWQFHEFTVSDIVTPTAEIMLRFVASDEDRGSIIEAAIDDLRVTIIVCDSCDPCDMNCDGDIDAFDIEPFLELLFDPDPVPCDSCTGDANGDGDIDAFDIEPFLSCLFP